MRTRVISRVRACESAHVRVCERVRAYMCVRSCVCAFADARVGARVRVRMCYANRAVENSNLFKKIAQNTTEKDISTTG